MAVLGAPYEDRALDEIQVVETVGVVNELQSEIQMVTSSAFHINEIQTVETKALPGKSLRRVYIPSGADGIPTFRFQWKSSFSRFVTLISQRHSYQ